MSTFPLVYTVVIVTYRRHLPLCDTLRAIAHHINNSIGEVIVVDQCPTGPLPNDVLIIPGLRYIVLDAPGMVIARNVGLTHARGEIVLFLDDDVVPLPGLIDAHLAAYTDPKVGGVAGKIVEPGQQVDSPSHPKVFDPIDGWRHAHFDHATPGDVMTARGCNMSFRRELLVQLGGFDSHIEIFRDDTDACIRVIVAGYAIRFVPTAGLIHLNAQSGGTRGTSAEATTAVTREVRLYKQLFRHYRDNLYFIIKHFHGRYRHQLLWEAYRDYVGLSRWPWRLVAKNLCFLLALWSAQGLARYRRSHPSTLSN